MPTEREELEQKLVEQAQQAIRKLLDELPESRAITLSDMEKATGVMGQAIMQQTLQRLVERQLHPTDQEIQCESCHTPMSRRGKRRKRVVTTRGEVEVDRPYYVCPTCGVGRFPPG
jgi:hypothetical protein